MTAFKVIVLLAAMLALAYSAPSPGFFGKHEHHTIHVPYNVHTIHHHHVKKVPIYKEVVKEVPVYKEIVKEVPVVKEVHVPVIKEVHVPVYKEVHVPVHVHHEEHHDHHDHHDFDSHKGWSSSGW
ncbi:uncharacterized protein DDB_G0272718 [Lucilia cuprina]|uniref:uncharacterized protein DDB_G0272718 n=1 Tax=Lucilia cuprina TaxID=7375 RepID=UPI001F0639A3|nr:uncharacterized protein DDB_G0272718 [Lucilia cuprina]